MNTTLVHSLYLDSSFGVPTDLESAGTGLENPFVYDNAARELKSMADQGLVKIVRERASDASPQALIQQISFTRLR